MINTLFFLNNIFSNINMSLYDKYHSDININYMYDLLSKVLKEDIREDIKNNIELKNIFIQNSKQIFNEVNTDDITVINKILLDKHINEFKNILQAKKQSDLNINENESMDDKYNELIQSRNIPLIENNSKNEFIPVKNPFTDLKMNTITEVNEDKLLDKPLDSPFKEIPKEIPLIQNEIKQIKDENNYNIPKEIKYPEYKVLSSKRSNIQSSRYNYAYNLVKNNIKSSEIKKITKMMIPLEDNYIFSLPLLFLKIKELNVDISFQLENVIEKDERKFGYYKALEDTEINKGDLEKITIDIRDVSETRYDKVDIAKVNILELKNNEIHFTCTNIEENNFLVNDYVKIINNYTKGFKINNPLKIQRIEKNILICLYSDNISKKYSDVDMKLMNTSNQNIIYFN